MKRAMGGGLLGILVVALGCGGDDTSGATSTSTTGTGATTGAGGAGGGSTGSAGSTSTSTTTSTSASTGAGGSGGSSTCDDGVQDGTETDVDCGGDCPPCDLGESCSAPADCASGACAAGSCVRWGRRHGGGGSEFTLDVAAHPDGGLVLASGFTGTITVDGSATPITSAGGLDLLVARYTAAGDLLWAKRIGGPTPENAPGIAVGTDGSVVLTGICNGPIDVDGTILAAAGGQDVLVVKLSPDGALVWGTILGSAGQEVPFGRAVDAAGNVLVAGFFAGGLGAAGFPVGGQLLVSAGLQDGFVIKLSPAGDPLWGRALGGASDDGLGDLAVDAAGDVVVAGGFTGVVDFGTGALVSAGGRDGVVLELSGADGATHWATPFGGASDENVVAIAADGAGDAFVFGTYAGSASIGASMFTSAGDADVVLAKLGGSGGQVVWAKSFGGAALDGDGGGVAVTPEGDLAFGTAFQSPTIDLGGGALAGQGAGDGLAARLSGADGAHVFSEVLGTAETQRVFDIDVSPSTGNAVISGTFHGALTIGADTLTAAGGADGYAASLGRLQP